ncbi:hypothetical protein MMC08_008904 [Hypocenomyce scalaris]|nr:hypothetical protein [Hypocenomyce scalaris]
MPKTITILGATGMQGGDIVKALLKEGSWKIRGVTGNGVHAVFAVTNFGETIFTNCPGHEGEIEYEQGVKMAEVAV